MAGGPDRVRYPSGAKNGSAPKAGSKLVISSTNWSPDNGMAQRQSWLWMAFLAALMTLTYHLGSLPLINPDEGRNAEVAREMKEQGSWLIPTYNGIAYLDKPAFYFKTVALSLAVFGENELAARLPSAVFGFAILALVWAFSRRQCGARPAALAVLVIATTPLFISQARTVIFDIALAFFVGLAIIIGYLAEQGPEAARRGRYLIAAAAAGLATLVKGPVGLVIPLLVLLVFHGLEGRAGAWKRLVAPANAAVYLVIVLPWFLGVVWAHPDFLRYGLLEETLKRFATGKFHRSAPVYYFLLVLPATFFPWSLLLPAGWLLAPRWRSLPSVSRLSVVWSLVVVAFFSVSQSKLPGYILSVTLPFGLLAGQLLDAALTAPAGPAARIVRTAGGILALLVLLVAVAGIVVASAGGRLPPSLMSRPEFDLGQLDSPLRPLIAGCAGLAALGIWGWWKKQTRPLVMLFALLPVLLITLGGDVFLAGYESKSGRGLAHRMAPIAPETDLAFYRCFPAGLPFYLHRTGYLFTDDGSELTSNYAMYALKNSSYWPPAVIPAGNFTAWMERHRGPVYLIASESSHDWLEAVARRRGGTVETLSRRYCGALLPACEP